MDNIEIRPGRMINIVIHQHPTSDTTVFLTHGIGGRSDQWREQIKALKEQYTLIIPDLLGHGESDKPKQQATHLYDFSAFYRDLQAIFTRYASKKNILIGHSYGGALSTALALKFQDQVNKLILIC